MCGILGILNFNNENLNKDLVIRMRDTMYHRGPDGAGIYLNGSIALGHRRLAIIDLSETGHQPMSNEDKTVFIVFNGEIYNYIELREELKKKGHKFHSASDTEVIIHQYEEDGERCLEKFNGMFSFILWDSRKKNLFAARDRFGIKPLYYYLDDKKIIFASEIKAIIEDPNIKRIPNYQAISDYLFASRALGSKTMFQNIKEVEPAHMISVNKITRQVQIKRYWSLSHDYNYSRKAENTKEELLGLLDDAVKIHCRSDAPLGCHLSGGLDTSTVVALTAKHRNNLKAFSIKFSDEPHIDETPYAKAVAKYVGAEYIENSPSAKDMARLLPYLMWQMDIPMSTDGGFSYYTVSQLAHKHVKVSLTGHGGDEIFAGYPAQFIASYNTAEMFNRRVDPDRLLKRSPKINRLKGLYSKGFRSIYSSIINRLFETKETFEDLWVKLHCGYLTENDPSVHKDFIRTLEGYSSIDDYIKPFKEIDTDKTLDKCLYHDLRIYLPGLLHLEDRASMSVSLESRVPLLDYRIIEFLATVPPEQKVASLKPKFLIREIASSLLPKEVWERKDKFPFPVPGRFWLTDEIKRLTTDILLSSDSLKRGIFKPETLKALCTFNDVTAIWPILNMELWFKIFIDNDPNWLNMRNPQSDSLKGRKE